MTAALVSIRRRLRRQRGAVALEAILSVLLMLGAFYTMWGAALIIYNQTKLNTGAQFAAQGAIVVYDRHTYRGGFSANNDGGATEKARAAAQSLLDINAEAGMAPDQFSADMPTAYMTSFDIRCAPSVVNISTLGNANNCINSPLGSNAANATYVSLNAAATGSYWLLSPLDRPNRGRVASDQDEPTLEARGFALSVGGND